MSVTENATLKSARAALLEDTELRGIAFCRAYSQAADNWLAGLLEAAIDGNASKVALIAIGGYGRGELCPGSDLDVAFVHRPRMRHVKAIADAVWYPVWDQGVHLDHSVRTPKEVIAIAKNDLKAMLGLLDARFVAGDAALAEGVIDAARELWQSAYRSMLPALGDAVRHRHDRHGDVAFLLEPELKEDRGGLRDLHALHCISRAVPGVIEPSSVPELVRANEILLDVRVELHRRSGKELDQLTLQEQDPVAEALGYTDADALMGDVALAGRTIAWAGDSAWRRVARELRSSRDRGDGDRPLGRGLVLTDGEITLDPEVERASDPALALRAAAAAAELGTVMASATVSRFVEEMSEPTDPWPESLLNALVTLLGTGHAAVAGLEALDQAGLLVRILPEWNAVRNKPQRNALHRFTVDRHLCEAAANAAALVRDVDRPDLLLVGTWLHDIGKGFAGDHTEAGIGVVEDIGRRMGFAGDDVATLANLVRYHLLLPDAAVKRDLDDPETVDAVARAVGNTELLHLLAALTEADSIATNTTVWNPWKARLMRQLVTRVARRLQGEHAPDEEVAPVFDPALESLIDDAAERRAAVVLHRALEEEDVFDVLVAAPDRPGLLSNVAGVLALHGLEVRSARVAPGRQGIATEVFTVTPLFERDPTWAAIESDLASSLDGSLDLHRRLEERTRHYAGQRRPGAALPAEPRVLIDNSGSARATIVEVRAPDGIGVLHRITSALADCSLDITQARVLTLGHEIVDNFYVTDGSGSKILDKERLADIEAAVLGALGEA